MERKYLRTSALLREQIKNNQEDPLPHHYLAISCLDRRRLDECIREVLEAIRLFKLQKSNAEIRFLSYYTASVAFYQKKDLANAEIYALNALDLHPDYVDAYCILTSIYFLRSEYDRCIEATMKYLCLLKSIESDPTTVSFIPYNTLNNASLAYTRLAIIYFEQDKRDDGVQALNNAVNCTNDVCAPYLMSGEYFMGQKDGLKRNPGSKEMMNSIAIMKRMRVTDGIPLK
jgi:tetratricopeptide (TPR) repeat protein